MNHVKILWPLIVIFLKLGLGVGNFPLPPKSYTIGNPGSLSVSRDITLVNIENIRGEDMIRSEILIENGNRNR